MANNGLSGTLSPSIGNLSHLQTLSLQNNKLSGNIPPEIGKLTNLNILDLSSNEFVGDIPSPLGQLTRLNYLRLDRNNLSGLIPVHVAKLPGLTFLDLSFNNLSGPVPKIGTRLQFSLLSMGDEQMELKNVCDLLGIRLIAYSLLGLGMLTGKYNASNLPKGPSDGQCCSGKFFLG